VDSAMKGLMGMAEGLKLENCTYNSDVIDAMFRQVADSSTLAFTENKIPGRLYAANYDYGRYGIAWSDKDYQNAGGGAWNWNSGNIYRNDGVDLEICSDTLTNGYDVTGIKTGEFIKFTVNAMQSAKYRISFRVAAPAGGGIIMMTPDNSAQQFYTLAQTGGLTTWKTQDAYTVDLTAGIHSLKFTFYVGGYNLNFIDVTNIGPMSVVNELNVPKEFTLEQNFPNPFNPSTVINYQVPKRSFVELKVFNMLGDEVASLVKKEQSAGAYSVNFNASHLSSGVYFYSMSADNFHQTKKLVFLK
ncbi:MAG: DUF5010 C-terminal domain-containing protein, partial [Bacteroidota bacterium]|nr:DUF5010 C-terminal domain-containing protein [Bacteroidota bacterium]